MTLELRYANDSCSALSLRTRIFTFFLRPRPAQALKRSISTQSELTCTWIGLERRTRLYFIGLEAKKRPNFGRKECGRTLNLTTLEKKEKRRGGFKDDVLFIVLSEKLPHSLTNTDKARLISK